MKRREFIGMAPAFAAPAVTATLSLKEQDKPAVNVDVSVLRLQPGDVLVISTPNYMSHEGRANIAEAIKGLCPDTKVMVIDGDLKLEGVLRG